MMKDTGYINVTKMCSSGGKDYKDWSRLKGSHELIAALENQLSLENTHATLQNSDLALRDDRCADLHIGNFTIQKVNSGNKTEVGCTISGTYIHPDLVPSVAGWISPNFQLKANRVTNGYIAWQYKVQLASATQQNSNLSQVILNKSKALNLNNIANRLMAQQVDKAEQLHRVAALDAHRAQQHAQNMETTVQQKDVAIDKLAETVQQKERRHQVWSSTHAFSMMRLNNPAAKLSYYAIRRERTDMSRAIKKIRVKHPYSIMVYQNSYVANPINLYSRLKTCGILRFNRNYCHSSVGEAELIAKLGELCSVLCTVPK